ncbi:MAG TPA: LytTR family DNA-binding domain-containing protein [Rhizomicrobium sp.]|jgi:DNA-binding LytR/AlgR family response regulator|nr:LytTR family DNA-binding domain-containing protein [Rhizomicrobium sp.]
MSGPLQSASSRPRPKGRGDHARRIGDVWQWLGTGGDALGTNGTLRRTFLIGFAAAAAMVAAVNALNVITIAHEEPQLGLAGPLVWEGSSWISLIAFFWIPWIGYRLAPPFVRPRWLLLLHVPIALLYSLAHVVGFVALRELAYLLAHDHYAFGAFVPHFLYELRKDSLGYVLFIAGFALIEHLLRQQQLIDMPGQTLTFDIRDGAKLIRVSLSDILAVTSAGNYVEFVLADGRRPLMRSPLSALEDELGPRGFVRTHRSWLVNAARMTKLEPEGSGDYTVELESVNVPLSRRYPQALERLRGT